MNLFQRKIRKIICFFIGHDYKTYPKQMGVIIWVCNFCKKQIVYKSDWENDIKEIIKESKNG